MTATSRSRSKISLGLGNSRVEEPGRRLQPHRRRHEAAKPASYADKASANILQFGFKDLLVTMTMTLCIFCFHAFHDFGTGAYAMSSDAVSLVLAERDDRNDAVKLLAERSAMSDTARFAAQNVLFLSELITVSRSICHM